MSNPGKQKIAILLMAFGGPSTRQEVEPYIKRITGGKPISRERMDEIKQRYELIGGGSPLLKITRRQAAAVERVLSTTEECCKVHLGMLHWHPFIGDSVQNILTEDTDLIVALTLNPYYTSVSSGRCFEEFEKSIASAGRNIETIEIRSYCQEESFIDALSETVEEGLSSIPGKERDRIETVFTAHSVPVETVEAGDPYAEQVKETVEKVAGKSGLERYKLAWQSGGRRGRWLTPDLDDIIDELSGVPDRRILVVPAGFVSDHVETLYDLDIKARKRIESAGMRYSRAPSLNVRSSFINSLATTIKKNLTAWRNA